MKDPNSFMDNLKSQMANLDKNTTKPTWERVAQTLKRNKRRRYATWLISSIGSLMVLVLIVYPFNQESSNTQVSPQQQQEQTKTNISVAKTTGDDSLTVDADLEVSKTDAEQTTLVNNKQSANKTNVKNTSVIQTKSDGNKNLKTVDSVDFIKGAAVKTTYYYYNDHNNVQLITSDKAVIDSIMNVKSGLKVTDTIKQ